jgi:hypothetical protein
MKLILQRHASGPLSTIGELSEELADGQLSDRWCWTLEDVIREEKCVPVARWKIPGTTAIPSGTYEVRVTASERFQRLMPQVMHVPGFVGIRIHSGNTSADTEGCILVGFETNGTDVFLSRNAFESVFNRLMECEREGNRVYLEVRNP